MKTYIGKIALSCLLVTGMVGCGEDFLNTSASDELTDAAIFSDAEAGQLVLNGIYDHFTNSTTLSGSGDHLIWVHLIAPELMGDDTYVQREGFYNYGRGEPAYGYSITPVFQNVVTGWQTNHKIIAQCNGILDNYENWEATATRDKLEGEARALRALAYLFIARMYGKPVKTNPQSPGAVLRLTSGLEDLPRSTVAQTYEQITKDIEKATTLLTNTPSKNFITKRAAHAIAARAYLDLGDYTNGTKHANAALEGLTLMTQADYTTKFCTINTETIWNYANPVGDTPGWNSIPSFWFVTNMSTYGDPVTDDKGNQTVKVTRTGYLLGYSSMRLTQRFIDMFEEDDVRKKHFPKDNLGRYLRWPEYTWAKVPKKDADGNTIEDEDGKPVTEWGWVVNGGIITNKIKHNGTRGVGDVPIIRGSEMYLIIAELAADAGKEQEALTALNTLRTARGASTYTGTGADLVNEIQNERRRELFAEGHRVFDIKRRGLPLKRSDDPEHVATSGGAPIDLPAGSDRFEWPIPQREIDTNGALSAADQNPAYRN